MREMLENEKKNSDKNIMEQGSVLDQKNNKIQYLTDELGKYEAELGQYRNK